MDNDDKHGLVEEERFEDSFMEEEEEASTTLALPSFVITDLSKRKAPMLDMKSWITMSSSLDGRDKIMKVLQYSTRILAWWFLSKVGSPSSLAHGQRFSHFFKSVSKSRKAFRLGKSIKELYKITNAGLIGLICWHLKQYYIKDHDQNLPVEENESNGENFRFSNDSSLANYTPHLQRIKLISTTVSKIHDSIVSYLRIISTNYNEKPKLKWWKAGGSVVKMIALTGFYLGDNFNYLMGAGALDDFSLNDRDRLSRRKRLQSWAGKRSNQSYFLAATVGLIMNSYSYHLYLQRRRKSEALLPQDIIDDGNCDNSHKQNKIEVQNNWKKEYQIRTEKDEQNQVLFLSLLKSCMDVIVFSNNDGIDFFKKMRGRKNHEVLHCLCGLISASTVLYNEYPDALV